MNSMERVLSDDLTRLVDRLSVSIPEGALTLVRRHDEVEAILAGARASLIEDYARWARALDDLENVWALAAWRSATEEPVESASRLAA